ncbi:hypothetical protein V8E53_007426 [Lactarius tabidus]
MESMNNTNPSDGESEHSPPDVLSAADRFSITPRDAIVLRGFLEDYRRADTETRARIVETAMGELYALRLPGSTFDKKQAKQKVNTWFYNHYKHPYRQLIRFTWRWSACNAFYHENKAEVTELTQQICGGAPGSQAFLGALQDATTQLWKKLSAEEQEKYRELAKEWSEDKPPRHVQAKMASAAYRRRMVRDFQTQLYKTCGIHSVVLLAYADESGRVLACMDNWNKVLDNGTRFCDFSPNWKDTRFWLEWMRYASACFDTDVNGKPEVPSVTEDDDCHAKVLQTAVWEYCIVHIRYTSGKKNAKISWSKLACDPTQWILIECYPEDFSWADPSKLWIAQVFELLKHWRQREGDGLEALIWNPSCKALNSNVVCSEDVQIRSGQPHESSSEPDSPDESASTPCEPDSGQWPSSTPSKEENFDSKLQKILDEDSENIWHTTYPTQSGLMELIQVFITGLHIHCIHCKGNPRTLQYLRGPLLRIADWMLYVHRYIPIHGAREHRSFGDVLKGLQHRLPTVPLKGSHLFKEGPHRRPPDLQRTRFRKRNPLFLLGEASGLLNSPRRDMVPIYIY